MKRYISTKIVNAEPMTRAQYDTKRGWALPSKEDPNREGYRVSCKNDDDASWISKDLFEENHHILDDNDENYD